MITSIFSKSKPINFLIVFFISLLALLYAIFKLDETGFSFLHILKLGLVFLLCYSSILLLDFIVSKNFLSQKSYYEILLFSLFLLTTPQIFLNKDIVLANFFILLALRRIVSLRTQKGLEKKLFDAAFLIGLASLIYFWAILFFPFIFVALLFYSDNQFKDWIIPFLGLLTVFLLAVSYSIIVNNDFFSALNFQPEVSFDISNYNSGRSITTITTVLSFGLWSSLFYLRDIKKKMKTFRPSYKVVFAASVIATLIIILSPNKNGSEFLFLFAPISIIITNYIETIEEKWFKELFLLALIVIPFVLLVL